MEHSTSKKRRKTQISCSKQERSSMRSLHTEKWLRKAIKLSFRLKDWEIQILLLVDMSGGFIAGTINKEPWANLKEMHSMLCHFVTVWPESPMGKRLKKESNGINRWLSKEIATNSKSDMEIFFTTRQDLMNPLKFTTESYSKNRFLLMYMPP